MATSKQKTAFALVIGAIVAITPSFLSYCQAREEIHEKYAKNHDEASHGYDALAGSITALQKTALDQHDYIVKLEGQISMLTTVLMQMQNPPPGGMRMTARPPLPTPEKPPARPELLPPPNFDGAPR